jgi:hypothetical protein
MAPFPGGITALTAGPIIRNHKLRNVHRSSAAPLISVWSALSHVQAAQLESHLSKHAEPMEVLSAVSLVELEV